MKIGILGTGNIGKTLVTRLSQAGHDVKVANSRGPATVDAELLSFGARAVTTEDALVDVDVVILSIPLNRISSIASLVARLPEATVVIDTSNYYPFRDEKIEAIERGQVESVWVAEQLGRPIARSPRHGMQSARPPWPRRRSPQGRLTGSPFLWLRIGSTTARSRCCW
jgi:predicted dinucleotide-binding enzyme